MLDDHSIIRLFLERSEGAIAALSEKYGGLCIGLARNILGSDLDAEECVSDSFLAAWNTIPPQRPDPLKPYILRLVRNIATARFHANTAQKRNSHYDVALEELAECISRGDTTMQTLEAQELSRQIDAFLAGLDAQSRVLFVRRYWYGDDISCLAKRFAVGANTISVRLHRIRGRLRNHLKKEGFDV